MMKEYVYDFSARTHIPATTPPPPEIILARQ